MSAKGEVIAVWVATLVVFRGILSGDFLELEQLMTGQSKSVTNAGLLLRILGSAVLGVILILGADADDTWADVSMAFLAAVTLLFFVTYASQLNGWISFLLTGVQGGNH
jgi:hypothetical protein